MERQSQEHIFSQSLSATGTTEKEKMLSNTQADTLTNSSLKKDMEPNKNYSNGQGSRSMPDMVNSPPHYLKEGETECIDAMVQVFGIDAVQLYSRISAFKYQWRQNYKHPQPDEDIDKAIWYLRFSRGDDPRNDKL